MKTPPPVPSTAIYSRSDGIVAWQGVSSAKVRAENIEVEGAIAGSATTRRCSMRSPIGWRSPKAPGGRSIAAGSRA